MKTYLVLATAVAVLTPSLSSAQSWRPINQRQSQQEQRINQGIRSGALTRAEAGRIRGQFVTLNRLEQRYRASNGLSVAERRDLDRRFDALSQRIRTQKTDRQTRR
ncbi:hypothetical protein [Sphingomonas montana]|uniref:hypothetical protein n=1 Tax=Sphingomonas montana TaxID=1843236 RepID=UPI00096F7380|nr:hypothetical protein [Sphingomonas montana]